MQTELIQVTTGGLLHDIGKIIFCSNIDTRAHSISGYEAMKPIIKQEEILQCICYHHKKELRHQKLADDALAYIVYIADNIAAGVDRRFDEGDDVSYGFDKTCPLESIFNLMNQNCNKYVHSQGSLNIKQEINYPQPKEKVPVYTVSEYQKIYQDLRAGLNQLEANSAYVNSLLELLESHMTYVPSSTNKQEVADISLFDHSKMTAAIAACIYVYLSEEGRTNFKTALFDNEKAFLQQKAFLLFSCDLSGIQSFIYTTSGEKALKTLRARSLYLEVLVEHIVDELLDTMELSRAQLIYTGGAHAYILLANTKAVEEKLQTFRKNINQWLLKQFGTELYLAMAWQPCSGNDLMNRSEDNDAYRQIFRTLSGKLGAQKISRYSMEELKLLNQQSEMDDLRECKECKRSSQLTDEDICSFCHDIQLFSKEVLASDKYFSVFYAVKDADKCLPLPNAEGETVYLQMKSYNELKDLLENHSPNLIRYYSKNNQVTGHNMATHIWMGDYHVREDEMIATFEQMAQRSKGVKRIGVLRADVDNLGQAFVNGFLRQNADNPEKYLTLSRTTSLSRSLSLFFKYYLNGILDGSTTIPNGRFSLEGSPQSTPKQVMIIYSGGDDIFLVGAWNEIIESAVDINRAFEEYTQGTLTLSAGIGLYNVSYPLIRMAKETGDLESAAKHIAGGQKNALSLFGTDTIAHTYHWETFEKKVVGEKLRFLQKHLGTKQEDEQANTGFLYDILYLLRHADENINLARYAYTLARRTNVTDSTAFCNLMYAWYLDDTHRQQLITAIYLYVYLYREDGSANEL